MKLQDFQLSKTSKPHEILLACVKSEEYREVQFFGVCFCLHKLFYHNIISRGQLNQTRHLINQKLNQLNTFSNSGPAFMAVALHRYHERKRIGKEAILTDLGQKQVSEIIRDFQTSGRGTAYYSRLAYRWKAAGN